MVNKMVGTASAEISNVCIASSASVVGKKEGDGALSGWFDIVMPDDEWGEKSWEKTESKMQKEAVKLAISKADLTPSDIDKIFSGDLLNQCIGAGFGLRELKIPFYGIYGACSTMIEGVSLASMLIDGGFAKTAVAVTSSHYCTAERQYRNPLEYGGQRTPSAQWTVTGSGAVTLKAGNDGICVNKITTGKIIDMGVTDANNMGGAMAPAAYETIKTHFSDFGVSPDDYDCIVTGDLGQVGSDILKDLLLKDGIDITKKHRDCGLLIYDRKRQDVHAGGSGCGCIASVLCGYFTKEMLSGRMSKILAVGTGALLSTTSSLQGESVPGIAHAISLGIGGK